MNIQTFNIVFRGVRYNIDVVCEGDDSTLFVEYADKDEDVDESEALKLTEYLIGEGFVNYEV